MLPLGQQLWLEEIPGSGRGISYIDWPPFPDWKARWWPKALPGFETGSATQAPLAAPRFPILQDHMENGAHLGGR